MSQRRRDTAHTTFTEYLQDCHSIIYQSLTLGDASQLSGGGNTDVTHKYYPMWLHPWADWSHHHQRHFQSLTHALSNAKLTPRNTLRSYRMDFAAMGMENEDDLTEFERRVERLFIDLLRKFADSREAQRFDFEQLWFRSSGNEPQQTYHMLPGADKSRKILPDNKVFCIRREEQRQMVVFVCDYKAVHKLGVSSLKSALAKPKLFMEVVERVNWNKTTTDAEELAEQTIDRQIAMALTQMFDYMLLVGVKYGYLSAGKAIVLLHVDWDGDDDCAKKTLYYHLCVPGEDVPIHGESHSAVAQLATFCLHSLLSQAYEDDALINLYDNAAKELQKWPNVYEDGDNDPLTRPPGNTGAKKRKQRAWSGNFEDNQRDASMNSDSRPTRNYCTQECLLSLKKGWHLDKNCPNVFAHYAAASNTEHLDIDISCTKHPIPFNKFTCLVEKQLHQNLFQYCVSLDNHGVSSKSGAIGTLFKVELAPYGYTFVGKGTQQFHLDRLQHESHIYSKLERLQGLVVPVHLGIINLAGPWGYPLPGGFLIFHMMLMSWAGEIASVKSVSNYATELDRSEREVWNEGVVHNDIRGPNALWNQERNRVMLIDFDRAVLRPPARHNQLTKLLKIAKREIAKRGRPEDILEKSGRKRARNDNGPRVVQALS